jgi:hypothetical protein
MIMKIIPADFIFPHLILSGGKFSLNKNGVSSINKKKKETKPENLISYERT